MFLKTTNKSKFYFQTTAKIFTFASKELIKNFNDRNILFVDLNTMPTLSMFYGIIVRMYYAPKEHNPPHIHIYYQEYSGTVDINTCSVIESNVPIKQLRLVIAWLEIHKEELLADWSLCQNGEKPFTIDPLK